MVRSSDRTWPEECRLKRLYQCDWRHAHHGLDSSQRKRWRDRKGRITQNVFAAVKQDYSFTYVLAGAEGSMNDASLLGEAMTRSFRVPEHRYYVADAGFGVKPGIVIPFSGVRIVSNTGNLTCWPLHHKGGNLGRLAARFDSSTPRAAGERSFWMAPLGEEEWMYIQRLPCSAVGSAVGSVDEEDDAITHSQQLNAKHYSPSLLHERWHTGLRSNQMPIPPLCWTLFARLRQRTWHREAPLSLASAAIVVPIDRHIVALVPHQRYFEKYGRTYRVRGWRGRARRVEVEVAYHLDATESALLPMSQGGYREEIGNGQTMGQPGMEMYLEGKG